MALASMVVDVNLKKRLDVSPIIVGTCSPTFPPCLITGCVKGWHVSDPSTLIVCCGHVMHVSTMVAPMVGLYVPAEHILQTELFWFEPYVPCEHIVHWEHADID